VLVPMFESGGEAHVVLTKRPDTMPSHQGEISFPGGGLHPAVDATLQNAALREAEEEIGLPPDAVEIVAELDTLATVGSRFTITPFVGLVDPLPRLVPHPGEVVKILEVPLSELLDDAAYHEEYWGTPDRAISFFELPGETVWGATARVLVAFLAHLTASP
jgi:8-oxo-dGTP pyrophosphatase MutT (NUDIX family)